MRFDKQIRHNEAAMNPTSSKWADFADLHKRFNSYSFGTQILFVPESEESESV
jgi:hypothetical protein